MLLDSYVRSYLGIPVVLGVALCSSKVLAHLYVSDQVKDQPEYDDLVDKIRHLLFNAPDEKEFFEAPVLNFHLYVYKIGEKHRFVTLVLHDNNVIKSFRAKQLQHKLQENIEGGLQLFEELSTKHTLSGEPIAIASQDKALDLDDSKVALSNGVNAEVTATIDEILSALNILSRFARRYLGPKITSNFWNLARSEQDQWLEVFEIKYSAAIVFRGDNKDRVNPLQMLLIREWTRNFMKQCCAVIRDFPEKFEQEKITEAQRKIISIYTSDYLHDHTMPTTNHNTSLFGDCFSSYELT